jgi:uncharacterized protein
VLASSSRDSRSYSCPVWPGALSGMTPFAVVSRGAESDALLALAGVGAGVINGVAGGGTLLSFPVLLALGYPALTANVTSTVGIWPGYLGGVAGFRREVANQRGMLTRLAPVAVLGAVAGSALLLTTPAGTFQHAAPWLVLAASLLYASQPLVARLVNRQRVGAAHRVVLMVGVFLTSVYGGYFGAGLGVILLALLGLTVPDTLARTTGVRTALSVLTNGVAALVFVGAASVSWPAAGCLAIGSLVGGFAGAKLVRHLPVPVFRAVVVLIGLVTVAKLLAG